MKKAPANAKTKRSWLWKIRMAIKVRKRFRNAVFIKYEKYDPYINPEYISEEYRK